MTSSLQQALNGWPIEGFDPGSPHAWAFRDLWRLGYISSSGMLTDAGLAAKTL